MINRDRVIKLIEDLKEIEDNIDMCLKEIDEAKNIRMKGLLMHSLRAYFLDFHILCEDYISITLKFLNKYRIGISAIEGMEIIKEANFISKEFFDFYFKSRKLRNRLARRYKVPKDEVLVENIKMNRVIIRELNVAIENKLLEN